MVKGYLLIKLIPGLESDALSQIRATPGVLDVNLVFGQWDVIAIAEAKTLFELARIVVGQVRGIQGVQVLSISEMGHILNRTLCHNQVALVSSVRPRL
jgi:hypothetical protein